MFSHGLDPLLPSATGCFRPTKSRSFSN